MSSIGELLRRERLRRGLDLENISRELKIAPRFLEAIEEDRFDLLPGALFAKSFVRQYARLLDLDGDDVADEVQRVMAPEPSASVPPAPDLPPISESGIAGISWESVGDRRPRDWMSSLPALALVVVVMLVCSGVYAFWQRSPRPVTTGQAAPPQSSSAPPLDAAAGRPEPAPPASSNPQPSASVSAPPQQALPPEHSPAPVPAPPSQGEASRLATPGRPVKVEVTAEEPVWVLARADGKYAFSGTLAANETRQIEGGAVVLRLGNAGGVSIKVNGKTIGPIGPKGQVREIQLTSGGFQIVAAPKPSLPLDNPI